MAKAIALTTNGEESYPVPYYAVGEICMMSTNTNPNSIFGYGEWELIDKEFVDYSISSKGFAPTDNISDVSASFTRSGHTITLNLSFATNVAFTDTAITLGTINFSECGVTRLVFHAREVGYSDGGNCVFMVNVAASTGEMSCRDVVGVDSMAAGSSCYITIPFQFIYSYMLDSACNKFYWRRTA